MRRFLLALLLCCLPFAALAEEETLYPAKAPNGLWGYINARAEWVIAPQFDGASEFRGDYAVVTVCPEDDVSAPDALEGIIDRTGAYVMEPVDGYIDPGYDGYYYGGKDTGIWLISTADGEGFFDIPSGYWTMSSGYLYSWVSDSRLLPVDGGYMDRTTGEMVIKGDFYAVDPGVFQDGIVAVSYTDTRGDPIKFFMMDEKGNVIPLPDGVSTVYAAQYSDGRMVVVDENERYGYADGQGNIVIPLQYLDAGDFSQGMADVVFPEGDHGYIDTQGNVIARGFTSAWPFDCGYAEVKLDGETRFIRADGQLVSFMDDRHTPIGEERIWMRIGQEYGAHVHLLDGEGNILTDEAYELPEFAWDYFTQGLQAVGTEEGWGFINLDGEVVIPLQFTYAENFDGALAFVRLGNQEGYIDRQGNVVYLWDRTME